ncbi:MAG: TPM domain-containing protein [Cyanobacteriota bacterium]|nr:TPM domain-containing protein [Cyanobacteriota bacterium]
MFGALFGSLLLVVLMATPTAPALALSATDLPDAPPAAHVLDQAQLLSRAAASDVSRQLGALQQQGIDATWVSVPRLDYELNLNQFAQQLLERWQSAGPDQLLLVIDAQTSATAVVGSPAVVDRLGSDLLRSTSRTTMAQPLRDGNRYRQASLDAIARISAVASGQDDPGEPSSAVNPVATARVPSREQTLSSNAKTWVLVLLVVGTVVPMLTWWVFSR